MLLDILLCWPIFNHILISFVMESGNGLSSTLTRQTYHGQHCFLQLLRMAEEANAALNSKGQL